MNTKISSSSGSSDSSFKKILFFFMFSVFCVIVFSVLYVLGGPTKVKPTYIFVCKI